ncbi:RagB/SusD family nutrient uptake outer membrane protein [Pedobacter hiemivivus]|uniref:Uncharacterized protein n=1 Tax=Pedobacter hiemivivus TaxID=2530454 RepID=A0A4V6N5W7_9SPHI|nr:RagB/SusD family nutrient uptake outer membrane protein [Pedobacter hiemivivus]TCC96476.1 hypothetical protein EZ444_10865 [Pedobacter hiemivivus]
MKRILTTIILLSILSTSCKKFLDVRPQGKSTQEELFKTQKGFRDVLTGAYIRMKGGSIYGGDMMWGNVEYLAINWDNPNSANISRTKLINGDYTDQTVKDWFSSTYENLYKVIADVNGILENIDAKKAVFTGGNYEIVKGEALTLRAFCHFDALRMFGPLPTNITANSVLPYVKTVTKNTHLPLSYVEFAKSILSDLEEAEALLKDVDPIRKYSIAQLNSTVTPVVNDPYLQYRQVRMNYYAVLALKARVYLWLVPLDNANKQNAARYAKMVIDAVDDNGAHTFRLGVETDRAAEDYTMSAEHISALSVYNLEDIANSSFGKDGGLLRIDYPSGDGYFYLNNLFPPSERLADIRWKDMWTLKASTQVMYKKFIQKKGLPDYQVLQIPLLRLSEMYLIGTECAESKTEAEGIYIAYCVKKGIPFTSFNVNDWTGDRRNKMIREYVREFYAEGQSFFTFKRYNVTTLPSGWTGSYYNAKPERYLIPKPDREISYTNN